MGVLLHSFGAALGERLITNEHLSTLFTTSDEWIVQRSGIKTRYWAADETNTSDLALHASRVCLDSAKAAPNAIIAATLSPDFYFPGIGVLLQRGLSLDSVPAFDIRQQCSGFLYGIELAASLIETKRYKKILLVGAELHSRGLDLSDRGRDTAVLFGDGAGACLVEDANEASVAGLELLGSELHSDGSGVQDLWLEIPGSSCYMGHVTEEIRASGRIYPRMNGRKVFERAVHCMTEVSRSLLARTGLPISEIAHFIPHQANLRINTMVAESLGLNGGQVHSTIEKFGNTTAATIPLGIHDAYAAGKIKAGQIVLSAAFGSGFTWGAALFRAR